MFKNGFEFCPFSEIKTVNLNTMLRTHLKFAIRNILKNKSLSLINILGLGIGMAIAILAILYYYHENSYDKFNEKYENIYILEKGDRQGLPAAIAPILKENIPEILDFTRLKYVWAVQAIYKDKNVGFEYPCWADTSFTSMFTLDFICGNPKTALKEINSIVITESFAKKMFEDENPCGKTFQLAYDTETDYRVTGVIKDLPTFHREVQGMGSLCTVEHYDPKALTDLHGEIYNIYLELSKDHDLQLVEQKINNLLKPFYKDEKLYNDDEFKLFPLKDIYFGKIKYGTYGFNRGDKNLVFTFISVGIIILLIASINFINLVTAKASLRFKEIGIKKLVGSHKMLIIRQILIESVVTSFIALVVALTIVQILLPGFNNLTELNYSFELFQNPIIILLLITGTILVGIISGLYPAIRFTSIQPISVLKGETIKSTKGIFFRRFLTVFQFTATILLLIGSISIYKQLSYLKNKDLGFEKENLLFIQARGNMWENGENIKNKLLESPNITGVTEGFNMPGVFYMERQYKLNEKDIMMPTYWVDSNYFKVMELQLLKGRNFIKSDYNNAKCIINESAAKLFGEDSPIGKIIKFDTTNQEGLSAAANNEIIGVVEDFNMLMLKFSKVKPLMLIYNPHASHGFGIRITDKNVNLTLNHIESVWNEYAGFYPFEYKFISNLFEKKHFKRDDRMAKILNLTTIITAFIAIVGLYALSSFLVNQRKKEISIRKAFGATTSIILKTLSMEYIILIITSTIIAWPIAYYFLEKWLNNFAYRIDISIWAFILSTFALLVIALGTVFYQTYKAANTNPARVLQYE
jgi:putative ABC transport system permease protein